MPDIITIANRFRRDILRGERKAAIRLIEAYGAIWNRLNKQLAKLTQEIKEARARGEIVNQFWLLRQQRYGDLLRQVDQEMRKFSGLAETTITKQQSAAAKAGLSDSVALMAAAAETAGVSASFNKLPVAAVENLVGVLGDGSPLRTLLDQLPRAGRAIVEQGLIEGVALGRNPRAIASAIRAGLGGNLNRALSISRTEVLRAYRIAQGQTMVANGDILSGWYWVASLSRRTCAACISLHGTFHLLSEPMQKSHVRCRCTRVMGIKGQPSPIPQTGPQWFKKQSANVQKNIIGTDAGYKAIRRGELKLEDFVGLRHSPPWPDQFHQLSVKRALAGEGRFPGDAPGRPK